MRVERQVCELVAVSGVNRAAMTRWRLVSGREVMLELREWGRVEVDRIREEDDLFLVRPLVAAGVDMADGEAYDRWYVRAHQAVKLMDDYAGDLRKLGYSREDLIRSLDGSVGLLVPPALGRRYEIDIPIRGVYRMMRSRERFSDTAAGRVVWEPMLELLRERMAAECEREGWV